MNLRYRLPYVWTDKVSNMEEFANGATQVTVQLNDGRELQNILISDATYIVAARGFKDLPFAIPDITDIYQTSDDRNPSQRGGWDFWDDWHALS